MAPVTLACPIGSSCSYKTEELDVKDALVLLAMHDRQAHPTLNGQPSASTKNSIPKKDHPIVSALVKSSLEYTFIANDNLQKAKLLKQNTFEQFCEETNLNGWHFMSKKNIFSRIFWAFIILISILLAGYSTFIIISEFLDANIIITIESVTSSLDRVVFPSIILCNQNKVGFVIGRAKCVRSPDCVANLSGHY